MSDSHAFLDDAVTKADAFRRKPFAQRLASTIAGRADTGSIAIGIYGPWGDGKSSVLGFISDELKDDERCVVINFNPWRFANEETLIEMFFLELTTAVNDRIPRSRSQKAKDAIGEWMNSRWAKTGITAIGSKLGLKRENVDELLNRKVEEQKQKLEAALGQLGVKLVFLIDDVDRLDPSEVHAVFRLVKLSANFQRTVFLLAFDYDIVASALGTRFAAGGGIENGRKYIEKIIQIPVELPKIDPGDLSEYLFDLLEKSVRPQKSLVIAAETYSLFQSEFRNLLLARLPTPRMCKRYVNAVQFAAGMLGTSVDGHDLLWVEGLRIGFPTVYSTIREHKRHFASVGDLDESTQGEREELIQSALRTIENPAQKNACRAVINKLFFGDAGHNRSLRAPAAFPAYFNYLAEPAPAWDQGVAFVQAVWAGNRVAAGEVWKSVELHDTPQFGGVVSNYLHSSVDARQAAVVSVLATAERDNKLDDIPRFIACLTTQESQRRDYVEHAVANCQKWSTALHFALERGEEARALWTLFDRPVAFSRDKDHLSVKGVRYGTNGLQTLFLALKQAFICSFCKNGVLAEPSAEAAKAMAFCAYFDLEWYRVLARGTYQEKGKGFLEELWSHNYGGLHSDEDLNAHLSWYRLRSGGWLYPFDISVTIKDPPEGFFELSVWLAHRQLDLVFTELGETTSHAAEERPKLSLPLDWYERWVPRTHA